MPIKIDRRRKAVLILECDSRKLEQQGLAFGQELEKRIKLLFPTNLVRLVKAYNEVRLLEEFLDLSTEGQLFKTIIIIGHSNRGGLQISADRAVDWERGGKLDQFVWTSPSPLVGMRSGTKPTLLRPF